ncbi:MULTISPECIES: hypothetical protein [unclassified Streptomyces]|uniref:hypothetical protein n=1 Tax=Streptomyces sp. NPDC127129 TaxID=3345373 RepID=UPI00362919C8
MRKLPLLVTGSVIAALSFGLQGTASAGPAGATGWPTGCTSKTNYENGAMARCSKSNGGHYKASAICSRMDGSGKIDVEAPIWRSSGWSYVFCPPATVFSSAGIVTKAS